MAWVAGDARLRGALSWGLIGLSLAVGCAIERAPAADETWLETATAPDVLAALGPEVVVPALVRFSAALDGLDGALAGWDGTAAGNATVLAAYGEAMVVWQELELMQIGPAASSLSSPVGEDLRDEVYSWPTTNPCRVDQVTIEGGWDSAAFYDDNLVNAYGLDALEHLLTAGPGNDCPSQVDINADGTWDALGDAGVAAQRAALAAALTGALQGHTATLLEVWSPDGGDLGAALALGADGPLGSEQASMNAVYDALFYLYTETLDLKLAAPLGLEDCGEDDCADAVELKASGLSTAAIAANLRGFRALFTGGEGAGMDDLLVELGHGDLAESILADTDAALALAEGLGQPIDAALASDPDAVMALYTATKAVGDALKNDVATVLSLEVPAEAAGDND